MGMEMNTISKYIYMNNKETEYNTYKTMNTKL
jgi:hypothetical protein